MARDRFGQARESISPPGMRQLDRQAVDHVITLCQGFEQFAYFSRGMLQIIIHCHGDVIGSLGAFRKPARYAGHNCASY